MADSQDIYTLSQMVQLGSCYIDNQDEPEDQDNATKMENVLTTITDLMAVEVKQTEPPDAADSLGGVSAMESY